MNDDEIYRLFYPYTFKPRNRFAPGEYSYVHSELKKVGVTEMLLREEYCEKCNTEGVPHCCYAAFTNGCKLNTSTHLGLEDAAEELKRVEELADAGKELEKVQGENPVSQKMFRAI